MRAPVEIFEDACLEWGLGPRLNPIPAMLSNRTEGLRRRANRWIDGICNDPKFKKKINCYFDYLDNSTLNGVADVRDGVGYIGLTSGAIVLPLDLFGKIFSHPDAVTHVGDASKEVCNELHGEGVVRDYNGLLELRRRGGYAHVTATPKDLVRRGTKELCSIIAFDFIVVHEMVHIAHGHIEYLKANCGIPFILEATKSNVPAFLDPITRQVLERDADWMAVANTLDNLMRGELIYKPGEEYQGLIITTEALMFSWSFAVCGLFFLWGLEHDLSTMRLNYHPPLGLRLFYAYLAGARTIQYWRPEHREQFKDCFELAFVEILNAASRIGAPVLRKEWDRYIQGFGHRDTWDHNDQMYERFNELYPQLEKYTHIDLPGVNTTGIDDLVDRGPYRRGNGPQQ